MLNDDELAAAGWAVNHLIDKHGYSAIVGKDNSRVSLGPLLAKLLDPDLLAEHDRAVAERAWDEGHGQALANQAWPKERKSNPYRKES